MPAHKRFDRVLNMTVVYLTSAEADAAKKRFDELVAQTGELQGNVMLPLVVHALWAQAHYGADALSVAADGVELEPLTWSDGRALPVNP